MYKLISSLCLLVFLSCNSKPDAAQKSSETETTSTGGDKSISEMISNPATYAEGKTDPTKAAVIEFEQPSFKFPRVKAGTIVTNAFKFKNTGKNPLIIKDAMASCGCTVAEFPKEPIAPGEGGTILAKFNTEGKNSMQIKYISVYANTIPNETRLEMEGEVYKD